MNQYKAISILVGIGITAVFLVMFLESKNPVNLFYMTLGIIGIIFGFFIIDKKINLLFSLFMALIGVNILQWLILLYIYYYNPVYFKTSLYEYLVILIILIITLLKIDYRNKLYSHIAEKTKNKLLEDKTKLILLFAGLIIIIGCLVTFIIYFTPIFLYGATFGLLAFIYGYYHENKKLNVSRNYVKAMGFVLILQYVILFLFFNQISKDDLVNALSISMLIDINFLLQLYLPRWGIQIIPSKRKRIIPENYPQYSGIKQTTEVEVAPINKKEIIVLIGVIILFIGIFAAFYQIGDKTNQTGYNYDQMNVAENEDILSKYSVMDTSYKLSGNISTESFSNNGISFNYPRGWNINSQSSNFVELSDENGDFQIQMLNNNAYSIEDTIRQSEFVISDDWNKIASYKLIIDNETAYDGIYTYKDHESGILMRSVQITLVKNDKKYLIYLQAVDENFNEEKSDFAVILNSFKVDEVIEASNYINPQYSTN